MSEVLTISYQLAELPSAQHRAGLAGLVFMVRWLKRIGHEGICEIEKLTANAASFKVNREGLEALISEIYACEEIEIDDKKAFLPKGSQVSYLDPTQDKLWLKLWRDFLWALLKQPASRTIFKNDEEGKGNKSRQKAIQDCWEQLKGKKNSVDLAGTDFLGAQAKNTEIVPFKDRGKSQFLLKFWVYAVQIYDPIYLIRRKDKYQPKSAGYAIVIPDVANLEYFCDEFLDALRDSRGRNQQPHWYFKSRPDGAVINLAPAAGLDFLRTLREQLARRSKNLDDIVLAVEVCLLSVSDDGQKNSIDELVRLDPQGKQIDEFARVQENCRNLFFITQRLKNIIAKQPWYFGFGKLCSSLKIEQIFDPESLFCRDAKESFKLEVNDLNTVKSEQDELISLEALIYDIVGSYISKKVAEKYGLEWEKVKGDEETKKGYNEKRRKIAQDAFYGFRSRSDIEFSKYFALTFGSVQQSYVLNNKTSFERLAQALYNDTEYIKSLTLLALSARS